MPEEKKKTKTSMMDYVKKQKADLEKFNKVKEENKTTKKMTAIREVFGKRGLLKEKKLKERVTVV